MDRRRFVTIPAASLSGAFLAACNANPEKAAKLLALAEHGNESIERGLFRHTAMDSVPSGAALAGKDFPKYFISDRVPVWDPAVRGVWRLEVGRAGGTPLCLTLGQPAALPRVAQEMDPLCGYTWQA